jgi:pimeloyl-ACP methyl ester carboxylesterase
VIRLFTTLTLFALAAVAQSRENVFQIKVGQTITGTERFSIADPSQGEGHVLTCKATLTVPGSSSQTQQTFTLNPRWDPQKYQFETESGGIKQVFEAWEDGSKFKVRGSGAGGKSTEKSIPVQPRTILVDNLVACHFQALLNRIAQHRPDEEPNRDTVWWLIVPQALAGVPARITLEGELDGSLNGEPIHLKRFRLQAAGIPPVTEDIFAEAKTLVLERVTVASQGIEMTREGFQVDKAGSSPDCLERNLTFPSAGLAIPGTLCVPRKMAGPFPAVVLIQGSGPHDRDETVGPNKPFRDIAWGLAAQGIATFRFEKRSFAFKQEFARQKLTIENDMITDALAALEFVAQQKDVDPKRVFVLGHSLGGQVTPLVAARYPGTAGAILMAASARPLDVLLMEQAEFLAKQQRLKDDDPQLTQMREALAKLRAGGFADSETFMGFPVSYWQEFRSLNELEIVKKLTVPVLVLQGGKDIQVRETDYRLWMDALAGKPPELQQGVLFPNLNHLFQELQGEATGAEYSKSTPVARMAINAIAEWIKKQKQ